MNLSDFSYVLPENLIGQKAIEPRDSCKLLVIDRKTSQISHHIFSDLTKILNKNTVLVLNDTKVFPARLFGTKETGGKTEVLLLKQISLDSYTCIVRGKLKNKQKIIFDESFWGVIRHCEERNRDAAIQIIFNISGIALVKKIDQLGKTPLPPYIHSQVPEKNLRVQYQTVYAKEKGSAAAPTAGLHFTDKLLDSLKDNGVRIEKLTLHVGLGTFKPVTPEQVASKTLHSESFYLSKDTADRLNFAKNQGKKIIAVGTTTCRVLESQSNDSGVLSPGEGETNIFIQPGYRYNFVDGLITNFHLPNTSLLMLVTSLVSFPNSPTKFLNFQDSLIGEAYKEAIKEKYQFFSFGDAMLIL
ncbi:tRNA preQ1(34) S-adenosylmethionine ribosyltransferase-isomerase QueA [bacterium]|nr:MAG: tRNA preQ1(34) S-adenosylmethionine ribosyltransferase-isomerase QueA [bacterium]